MSVVVVTVVRSRIEADIVVGLLQGYGIAAMATSDDMAGLDLAMQQSTGVRVLVPAEQLERARRVLAEAQAESQAEEAASDQEPRPVSASAAGSRPARSRRPRAGRRPASGRRRAAAAAPPR